MQQRLERDTMGEIEVAAERLWGAQTERSRRNFSIGSERMPLSLVEGLIRLKRACAQVNRRVGKLDASLAALIVQACDELLSGDYADEFPLSVWQTG